MSLPDETVIPDSTFLSVLDRFADLRVLCVGDVMLDRFIYGRVDRISPEAPIPVFSIRDERAMLGGAGNVARNLVALGTQTSFVSVVGNDKVGHEITSMIGNEKRITPYLLTEAGRTSTTKTRFVAGTHQVLRADREVVAPISETTARMLVETVRAEMAQNNVVILSDYGKGVFTPATLADIIDAARARGIPVIVDPKSRDFGLYKGATCVSPNLHELANAVARELHTEEDIAGAARSLMEAHGIASILVTRSRDGMTLVSGGGALHHIPARAQEVFDVSGAGDTAIATLSLGIAAGLETTQAAELANLAAGIVVGRLGTAVATTQDLKTALMVHERASFVHKILPTGAAEAQVEQWKREGKTVGFTNGCFDLMHPGHLSLLHETKFHCDKLIVGLNSDDSVKRLKGPNRPVNGEVERALLLASLAVVDMVVIFEEDTPRALIEALKPSVLVKGADYQRHQVVGHDIVDRYGGKIILVPLKEGYSTTNLIRKMA
jgi:D-beta-D-heptose 7-phosphate kinase/D-beta-D-heptose 1-phosphate adenosyltransferase